MPWPTQIDAPDALASNDFLEVNGTIVPIPATLTTPELTAAFGAPNMSVSRSFGTTRQLRSDDALGDAATIVYSGILPELIGDKARAGGRLDLLAAQVEGASKLWRGGLYVPLTGRSILRATQDGDVPNVTFSLTPTFNRFRNPVLDDVAANPANATFALESEIYYNLAPILSFEARSRWSAPLTFSSLASGTVILGALVEDTGVYGLMSLGTPVSRELNVAYQNFVFGRSRAGKIADHLFERGV